MLVICVAVEVGGITTVAPGLIGMMKGVAVIVLIPLVLG